MTWLLQLKEYHQRLQDLSEGLISQLAAMSRPEVPLRYSARYLQAMLQYNSHKDVSVLQNLWQTVAAISEPQLLSLAGSAAVETITDLNQVKLHLVSRLC